MIERRARGPEGGLALAAYRVSRMGKPKTRKCSRQRQGFLWSGTDKSWNIDERGKLKYPTHQPGSRVCGSIQKNLVPSPSARLEVVINTR